MNLASTDGGTPLLMAIQVGGLETRRATSKIRGLLQNFFIVQVRLNMEHSKLRFWRYFKNVGQEIWMVAVGERTKCRTRVTVDGTLPTYVGLVIPDPPYLPAKFPAAMEAHRCAQESTIIFNRPPCPPIWSLERGWLNLP